LKDYPGAVIITSHDRRFLDVLTNRTIEIANKKIYDYPAPYSRYVELLQERLETQRATYLNQQKKIKETQEFIDRFRYKATKASQVQSRIKALEKMDIIEVDTFDQSRMNLRFPPAPRSGEIALEGEELSVSYGDLNVLEKVGFIIERGEKVAFVGRNGEGKTTLVKMILQQKDFTGNLKIGYNVKIGYYAQNQTDILNVNKTVFQTVDEIATGEVRTKIRDILGAFLFSGEDIDKPVKVLSGGERARLSFACLLLEPVNLLILDEPTHHLDMISKNILKQALLKFNGTIILVSHDRDFISGLTTKTYEFRDKKIKEYLGDIQLFLDKRKIERIQDLNVNSDIQNETAVKLIEIDREIRNYTNQYYKSNINQSICTICVGGGGLLGNSFLHHTPNKKN
jgi:ATP-binding cassette subfamily F protein 3